MIAELFLALQNPPNILLVVGDDIGVDRVGCYEEQVNPGLTPTLDSLAEEGLLFRNAWANPMCSQTRATILTGRYGKRTGVLEVITRTNSAPPMSLGETIIPEALPLAYTSVAVGKWHLGKDELDHPNDSGFPYFYGSAYGLGQESYYDWTRLVNGQESQSLEYATTDLTDEAIQAVTTLDEPWFLYLPYSAPHAPFEPPPDDLHSYGDIENAGPPIVHRAMAEAMDRELGRLLEYVPSNTLIIFIGDNGTPKEASQAPFLPEHAKGTMYEGGVNVPLIIKGPGVREGEEILGLVNSTDLFATLMDVSGSTVTAEDSVSLVPYFTSDIAQRDYVYAERVRGSTGAHWKAARDRRYKLLRQSQEELYDLWTDPFETTNLLDASLGDGPAADAYDRLLAVIDG